MKMIVSKTITRADVTANNLNEDTTTGWNPLTTYTYVEGTPETVQVTKEEDGTTDIIPARIYTLLGDSEGDYPPDNPTLWFNEGAVNRDKMFDEFITTQAVADGTESTNAGKIVLRIKADGMYTVSCFGLYGTSIQFKLLSSTLDTLDDVTYNLTDNEAVDNWYAYFFDEFYTITKITHEFPVYKISTMEITVDNTNAGQYPKLGSVILGQNFYLGETREEPTFKFLDYSVKDRNSFGDLYLKQGLYADEVSVDLLIKSETVDVVRRALTSMRGTATVYNCNNSTTNYSSLILLGFFQDFEMILGGKNYSTCSLTIETLT